jgi:hypothetical protein
MLPGNLQPDDTSIERPPDAADLVIKSKAKLYKQLSKVYYLPKANTAAVTIEMLESIGSGRFYMPYRQSLLTEKVHKSCRSPLLTADEVHKFVEFAVHRRFGKFFPFESNANLHWYSVVSYNVDREIHNQIFHEDMMAKVIRLGRAVLPEEFLIKTDERFGAFRTKNRDSLDRATFAAIQRVRTKMDFDVLDLRRKRLLVTTRLIELRQLAFRIMKRVIRANKKKAEQCENFVSKRDWICDKLLLFGMKLGMTPDEIKKENARIKALNPEEISAKDVFKLTGLKEYKSDLFFGETTELCKAVASNLLQTFTVADTLDETRAIALCQSYLDSHSVNLENLGYCGVMETELVNLNLHNDPGLRRKIYTSLARLIFEHANFPPLRIDYGGILKKHTRHQDIIRIIAKMQGVDIIPTSFEDLKQQVLKKSYLAILLRIFYSLRPIFDLNEFFQNVSFPVTRKSLLGYMLAIQDRSMVQRLLEPESVLLVELATIIPLQYSVESRPALKTVVNELFSFHKHQIRYLVDWRNMILQTTFKDLVDVLEFFCPQRAFVRLIEIEMIHPLLTVITKLVFCTTHASSKKIFAYNVLNTLLRIETYEGFISSRTIYEVIADDLCFKEATSDILSTAAILVIGKINSLSEAELERGAALGVTFCLYKRDKTISEYLKVLTNVSVDTTAQEYQSIINGSLH